MNYQKQYANKINWQNKPSTSTPLNATNLNKMDNALWYMDNALYMLANAVGGGSSIRGGIISSIASNTITTHVTMRTGESLATDELLLLRSDAEGAGNNISIYTDEYSAEDYGLVDLDGEETSVTLTDTSILLLMLDTDEYIATVLGVLDENSGFAGLGIGKMTSYSSNVVDTDIDLHRAPEIGDRILLYCNSAVSDPSSIKTYNNGTAISNATGPFSPINYVKGFNVLEFQSNTPLPNCWALVQAVQTGMPESPLAISHGGTGNSYGYIRTGAEAGSDIGDHATAEGAANTASGDYSHTEGYQNTASGSSSHVEGWGNTASNSNAHAEGSENEASGENSHAEGWYNTASGDSSHAEGASSFAEGMSSHAEGTSIASGIASHSEGGYNNGSSETTASGDSSHAEGASTTASGNMSHAEGFESTASAQDAHAEGSGTTASNAHAHAEGYHTTASGNSSHAGGTNAVASGLHSFAHGQYVNTGYAQQTAFGRYNDNKSANLFEIGNGTANNARSNAMEVTANGNVLDGNGNDLASVAALEQSASGNPIIVNAQGIDAKELSVELEPIQDLHGYDHPWAGGAGKNHLPMTVAGIKALNTSGTWDGNVYNYRGVDWTILTDNADNVIGIKANGTANQTSQLLFGSFNLVNGTQYAVTDGTTTSGSDYNVRIGNASDAYVTNTNGGTATFTADTANTALVGVVNGKTANNIIFLPMIRLASVSDATFAPYTNLCPISGRTETSVNDVGKNRWNVPYIRSKVSQYTHNGITYNLNADGTVDISTGTVSGAESIFPNAVPSVISEAEISNSYDFKPNTTYTVSFGIPLSNTYHGQVYVKATSTSSWSIVANVSSGTEFNFTTLSSFYQYWVRLQILGNGTSVPAMTIKPMIRPSGTSADFEPYKPSSATISFGQTVYGARIDFKTGVGIVDKALVDMGDLTWYKGTGANADYMWAPLSDLKDKGDSICSTYPTNTLLVGSLPDMSISTNKLNISSTTSHIVCRNSAYSSYTAEQVKTAMDGVQLCYELATPITIQLTPSMLELLKGYNYITADGEMDLVYIPESVLPTAPTTDGTYKLICTVSNGVPTFSWAAN